MAMIDSRSEYSQRRWYHRLWERLTRPSLVVEEVGTRRQVRLLAGLTLILATVISLAVFTTLEDENRSVMWALAATAGFLFAAYALSRSRWHRLGAYLVVLSLSLIAFLRIAYGEQNVPLNLYAFLPITFLFCTILLSQRSAVIIICLNLAAIITVPMWAPSFTYGDMLVSLGPLFSLGFLLLLAQYYRDKVEQDRLKVLEVTNHALEQLRVELDERVRVRTKELSEASAALQASQERYSLAVDGSNDGIWDWNLRTNEIYFSPRWKAMIGYDDHEIANEFAEFENRLHPEDRERVVQTIDSYLEGKIDTFNMEIRLQHKDESYRWISIRGAMQRDENGEPIRLAGSHSDITKRKQAEVELISSLSLLQGTLESTADGILVTDSKGNVVRLNQRFLEMWQVPPEISQAQDDDKLQDFLLSQLESPELFVAQAQLLLDQPEIESFEVLHCRDGRVFERLSMPQLLGNHIVGRVWSFRDVSERVRSEQKLIEEQIRTREILESVTIPLVVTNISDGLVVYVNEPLAEIMRLPRAELLGEVMPDFYQNPADRERYLAVLQAEGSVNNYDLRLNRADGEQFWALVSGRIIHFQGEPAIITSIIDVTERREAQAALARRAKELETVADVSTVAATNLEPSELLEQVVNLTKDRFDLYHAHIYLLDESQSKLVLTSGAGQIGRQMVAEGRTIPLAQEQSLVARAARTGIGVVINDVQAEPGFLPHPLLPDTRAEMSIPLIAGSEVQGVLDVQANRVDRFSAEDINIFTTLAAQTAVALQNARRYAEVQRTLDELTRLQRIMAREGWEAYFETQQQPFVGYAFDGQGAKPIAEPGLEKNGAETKPVENVPETAVSIPIAVRGETIGRLGLRRPDGESIPPRKQALLQSIAQQVSEALERARLSEQTQQALAETERRNREMAVINNIVTQIAASLDLQHSLQIVVDELVTAVGVDQVRVALLQPDKNELLVVTEHYDQSKSTSALGETIPVLGNELTQEVMQTREMVVVEDAQNNPRTAPVHELFRTQGIETFILLPLVVNDEVIGTVGLDLLDTRPIDAASLQLAETIVYQAATAVQNARLFEQTQAALAETEMLYTYSSRLNTATSLEAVLEAASMPGFQVGAAEARLLIYDRETNGTPENGKILATLPQISGLVGTSLHWSDQPYKNLWPANGKSVVFVGDVKQEARLQTKEKSVFKKMGVRAMAIMFLTVGRLNLGQILIYWDNPQTFTDADERLFGAIAQQASSVVYNRLLFNQTEEALSETAALYQASTDLNSAQTFDQVLTALRQHTILGRGSVDVTLNYFSQIWEDENPPKEVEVLARWTTLPEPPPNLYKISHFPEAVTMLQADEVLVCENVAADERLSEKTKALFMNRLGAKSLVFVPLIVGGQRVGFLSGAYAEPMQFSEAQIRRLNVLARQAVVTMQSIRLFQQTQAVLAETEGLYLGSEHIVMSSSEEDILQALIQSTMLQSLDRANLFMFDEPIEDGVPRDVTAVAIWENEGVPRTVEVGTRFTVENVPFVTKLKPDLPIFVEDVKLDSRVDDKTREVLAAFGMRSFILFPLVAGNQWLGVVSGQSAVPVELKEAQVRRAISLVNQAAMVMQSTILYRQVQARARREQTLRELATKLRSSTDIDTIMRTAVAEIGRTLGRRSFITLDKDDENNGAGE